MRSIGQNSMFLENGHVAYQITLNNDMVANVCPQTLPPHLTLG